MVSSHSGTPLGVGTSHRHFDIEDSSQPELGGSHHFPPCSILYVTLWRLHPNGSFSCDSQVGVPKLSRVGVLELWGLLSPDCKVQSRRGLNQSCRSFWATTFPHIIFSVLLHEGYIQMVFFPGLPSWSPKIVPSWSPGTLGAHISWLQGPI